MATDRIYYGGVIGSLDECGIEVPRLLESFHVYQEIRTRAYQPLHLNAHLEILQKDFRQIYNSDIELNASDISEQIIRLLKANRYPPHANTVRIRAFHPPFQSNPSSFSYLMEVASQLVYPHYTLGSFRPELSILPCSLPFPGVHTSVSLQMGRWSHDTAACMGSNVSVLENEKGILTHIEDEPLFAQVGRELLTTPRSDGANDSVMRRLIMLGCKKTGLSVREYPLCRALLDEADELFAGSPQGLYSISKYNNRRYFNVTANKLLEQMQRIETLEFF